MGIGLQIGVRQALQAVGRVGDNLAGPPGRQHPRQIARRVLQRGDVQLSRGHIAEGQPRAPARQVHRAQEVVIPLMQAAVIAHRARRHHANHLALHQPFGLRRVLRLLTDGHLVPALNQAGDVCIRRVIGHTAHGRALLEAAVAPGEGQLQLPAGQQRVIKEHLVEVPQAIEQYRVRVLLLDFHILLHHRGQLGHNAPLPYKLG